MRRRCDGYAQTRGNRVRRQESTESLVPGGVMGAVLRNLEVPSRLALGIRTQGYYA